MTQKLSKIPGRKKAGSFGDHKFNMCQRSNVAAKQLSHKGSPCLHQRN